MPTTAGDSTDPSTARTSSVGASAPSSFKKKSRFFRDGKPTWDMTQSTKDSEKEFQPRSSTSAGDNSGVATKQNLARDYSDQASKAVPEGLSRRGFGGGRNTKCSGNMASNVRPTTSALGSYNFHLNENAARKSMADVRRPVAMSSGAQNAAGSSQSSRITGGDGSLSPAVTAGNLIPQAQSNPFSAWADSDWDSGEDSE